MPPQTRTATAHALKAAKESEKNTDAYSGKFTKQSSGDDDYFGGRRVGYYVMVLFFCFLLFVVPYLKEQIANTQSNAIQNVLVGSSVVFFLGVIFVSVKITFIQEKKLNFFSLSIAEMAQWLVYMVSFHTIFLCPIMIGLALSVFQKLPSLTDIIWAIVVHFLLTLISMSVCLHRFFSHGAFKANRPMTFLIGVVGCLAYQWGPMWWSSKHRRHHKYCDKPQDPHSWARYGLAYAFMGWTLHPSEFNTNVEWVHNTFKDKNGKIVWELLLLDKFFFVPTWAMHVFLYAVLNVSPHSIMFRYTLPTTLCSIATLWFNCKFHPPPLTAAEKMVCNSINLVNDPLAMFHGEAFHGDHHMYPMKAQRPGYDLGWYFVLRPLMALGIVKPTKIAQTSRFIGGLTKAQKENFELHEH